MVSLRRLICDYVCIVGRVSLTCVIIKDKNGAADLHLYFCFKMHLNR